MKIRYLAIPFILLMLMIALVSSGCVSDIVSQTTTADGEDIVGSCVGCHSDADALYYSTDEVEEAEAESSGEG